MTTRRCLRGVAFAFVAAAVPLHAHAQLAPTGAHYAARASDTGYELGPSPQGGFSASIPLDLPPARGGLPIPLQVVSGARGFGAAGVGWDVPLSYVLDDRSFVRRRPAYKPGDPTTPRERITVALPGRSVEMVPDGAGAWVGRLAPDFRMSQTAPNMWKAVDGRLTYTFVHDTLLDGTGGPSPGGGMFLLSRIEGAGGASLELTHEIHVVQVPGSAAPAVTVDLSHIDYNPHPTDGCFKNQIVLNYEALPIGTQPSLSFTVVGNLTLARQHKINSIGVTSRATCGDSFKAIRSYTLDYSTDPDTRLQQLSSVSVHGRAGTPEETASIPVARYSYGAATQAASGSDRALHYVTDTTTIGMPSGAGAWLANTAAVGSTLFDAPGSGENYASLQSLTDFTGDGRPDLVFYTPGGLQIARNLPTGATPALGAPTAFSDATFTSKVLDARSSTAARFGSTSDDTPNDDYVWRQAIDVNGDGRVDLIDATEDTDVWTIYVNTPDSGPSGIKWVKRAWNVGRIRTTLVAAGVTLPSSSHVPLSRRRTGQDHARWRYFTLNDDDPEHPYYEEHNGSPVGTLTPPGDELTYVDWELADVNGDGYPDFVFNSAPVRFIPQVPEAIPHQDNPPLIVPQSGQRVILRTGPHNSVQVGYNIAGVRMEYPTYETDPFSEWGTLVDSFHAIPAIFDDACGLALWVDEKVVDSQRQTLMCALVDVNGDGLLDFVQGESALLGTGHQFNTSTSIELTLPDFVSRQDSGYPQHCPQTDPWFATSEKGGLRDLTGDGIPDLVADDLQHVYIGTGAGFSNAPVTFAGAFEVSREDETCDGTNSNTMAGLFDIDGDGKPDVVQMHSTGSEWVINVTRLVGGGSPGAPEAGRIVSVDNGAGAVTAIHYRSAKEDATTQHQVPFPEIVVDRVETNAHFGFGGSLSAKTYAYGNNSLFYDSVLDGFRPTGYLRSVELTVTGTAGIPNELLGSAVLTDRYPYVDSAQPTDLDRFLRVGRVSDVNMLAVFAGADPWSLLTADTSSDTRRMMGRHEDTESRTSPGVQPQVFNDCADIFLPYDTPYSLALNFGPNHWWPCSAPGVGFTKSVTSWRGSSGPPSSDNVQTRTSIDTVDSEGRPLLVRFDNDVNRSDDDLCMDITYAAPISVGTLVPSAPAIRTIYGCTKGTSDDGVVFASESFEYDHLPVGTISTGLPTAHTVHRYDGGVDRGAIREYDAWYDGAANPVAVASVREDGAQRTTTMTYDAFGLAPTSVEVAASGIPKLITTNTVDPYTTQVIDSTDPNGTVRGSVFDGFGRTIYETISEPATSLQPKIGGVLAAWTYWNFDGNNQSSGRRVELKTFSEPVEQNKVKISEGRVAKTYLDELGRVTSSHALLGDDYSNEELIVGARTYDGLGRVSFEADPYPASQSAVPAYGTTTFYNPDGSVAVAIRGNGPQPYTTTSDASAERFPTLYTHTYTNHQLVTSVQTADALAPSSPQSGVQRKVTSTAIGWDLSRETWQGATRLENAALSYDRLGQLASMTRYQDPASGLNPVTSTFHTDSLGQVVSLKEPESAPQSRTYSNWGELLETNWSPPSPEPSHSMVYTYDALGRLTYATEKKDGVIDGDTEAEYLYDAPQPKELVDNTFALGRLSSTHSAHGRRVDFSYDGLGNVNARTYYDKDGTQYGEQQAYHADGSQMWTALELPDNSYSSERVDYEYDTAGRLRWMWYSSPSEMQELFSASSIDAWGRLHDAKMGDNIFHAQLADVGRRLPSSTTVSTATKLHKIKYNAFDAVGRVTSQDDELPTFTGTETVTYDALGRLATAQRFAGTTTVSRRTFSYDPLGNLLKLDAANSTPDSTLSYLGTDRDRICRIGYGPGGLGGTSCNVEYDTFGNVVTEPTRTGKNYLSYFNSGSVHEITNSEGTSAAFEYDPFGQVEAVNITSSSAARIDTNFGSLIRNRFQKTSSDTVDYVERSFPGAGFVVSRRGKGGPWVYQFSDSRGVLFTSDLNGTFVQDNDYAPFGENAKPGGTPGSGFKLLENTTEQWNEGDALDELGLVYVGARLYDPVIGRFLSRDPLLIPRTASTSNPYAFAANDPVNLSDPTGLDWQNPACIGPECDGLDWLFNGVLHIPFSWGNPFGASGGSSHAPTPSPMSTPTLAPTTTTTPFTPMRPCDFLNGCVPQSNTVSDFDQAWDRVGAGLRDDPGPGVWDITRKILGHAGRAAERANRVLLGTFGHGVTYAVAGLFGGQLLLDSGPAGYVIRNALSKDELAFAEEIADFFGGRFEGAPTANFPGIDGTLDGIPASLKETNGRLGAVLSRAGGALDSAAKAGYHNVEVFIRAPNVGSEQLIDFARNGPMPTFTQTGTVSAINIKTADGWVRITNGRITIPAE